MPDQVAPLKGYLLHGIFMAVNKDIVAAVNRNGCVTAWIVNADLEKILSSDLEKRVCAVGVDGMRVVPLLR